MAPILPGATIGILGGGQLGRMTAMAARSMGYRVHALDPDPECPAKPVVDRLVTAKFDDADAAADLARHCDVVTLEIEQIGVPGLEKAMAHVPVRPGPRVLEIIQNRSAQKSWLTKHGFPLGDYHDIADAAGLAAAVREYGAVFAKANRGGYDGRSQVRVRGLDDVADAWPQLGHHGAVAERALDLAAELSVMVARSPSGSSVVYPPALNHHERQVLAWSMLPAPIDPVIAARACEIARGIADGLGVQGLLAVEMFLLRDGTLLVNELAPRPHNSFHESELACLTSQFEQLVRAVCDLPLGDASALRPAAIVNLFGDLWHGGAPRWDEALAEPCTRLHLYGKASARPGRKMGHISAVGDTATEALARAQAAYTRLAEADRVTSPSTAR